MQQRWAPSCGSFYFECSCSVQPRNFRVNSLGGRLGCPQSGICLEERVSDPCLNFVLDSVESGIFTLNNLQGAPGSAKRKMRKGRGIAAGQGHQCGFGMRGQKSRSGRPVSSLTHVGGGGLGERLSYTETTLLLSPMTHVFKFSHSMPHMFLPDAARL